ncbi:hypothetical protein QM797_14795 [Rhodococcus sp. IEGM 1381]|uniref:hypothetical protein n=1 Tax=Rhodococcus sp. IEGM 1381 TaxID=3047085 RepID=UPI0024B85BC2|nr:hypothetical protein [Rhodococcus sp. IEGM 1381]MDI9895991.1 hypothetical protein [Rhodococcus sp. IEGM 1381]
MLPFAHSANELLFLTKENARQWTRTVVNRCDELGIDPLIAEQFVKKQRAAAEVQQRALSQTELAAAGEQAASVALGSLDAIALDAHAQIRNSTADQVDLRVSLHQLVENLRSNIETGTRPVGG